MHKPVQLTLVVDNEIRSDLTAEHGFAVWIESGEKCFLFDTGQGGALESNARSLNVDLGRANALVLSHGHYDHTGGIPAFLAINSTAPIFYGQGATLRRFSCPPDHAPNSAGMFENILHELGTLPKERLIELQAPRYLAPAIGISGPIPRLTSFEDTGGPFYLDEQKQQVDTLVDDLSMWFETDAGLVILTGCCHSGLVNTVSYIRKVSGIERVNGIIGGLHLLQASEKRLEKTQEFIADCELKFLIPCHCTGPNVVDRFVQVYGEKLVRPGRAGQTFDIGFLRD